MNNIDPKILKKWNKREPSENFERIVVSDFNDNLLADICRKIVSFLNASGGILIVSLSNDSGRFGDLEYILEHNVNDGITPRPSIDMNYIEDHSSEDTLFIIDIPLGSERPYSFEDKIYIRNNANTEIAKPQKILELLGQHEDPNIRWERQIVTSATIKDLDEEKLYECINREDVRRFLKDWNQPDQPKEWLFLNYFHLGLRPLIRNSAVVLFGKNPNNFFQQHVVRAVSYDTEEFGASRIVDDKTFDGNIFEIIKNCYNFCERNSVFSSDFPDRFTHNNKSFQRSESMYSLAIREAILNAIVHRDYTSYDSMITLKISPGQIEIWNPGSFPEGTDLEKLENFRVSRPPNPDIAHTLQRMGYIERLGSGINRIISIFKDSGLNRPHWEQVGGGVRVTLNFNTKHEPADEEYSRLISHILNNYEVGEVISKKRLLAESNLEKNKFEQLIKTLQKERVLLSHHNNLFEYIGI